MLEQPFAHEHADGIPHGGAAYPQRLGEAGLGDTGAIRRAAAALADEAREALTAATQQMLAAVGRADPSAYTGADLAFHRALVRAARDRWLLSAWENMAPVIAATLTLGVHPSRRSSQEIATGHEQIMRFVLDRDALSAEAVLRRHLRGAVSYLLKRFQAPPPRA